MKVVTLHLLFFFVSLSVSHLFAKPKFQDGDIIFQRSQSSQSPAIAAATNSPYTHVGLIFLEKGMPVVFEASDKVTVTPLAEWTRRGKDSHFVVKRLKSSHAKKFDASKLRSEAEKMKGRHYDLLFDWSDTQIYCSELVWKVYARACGIELVPLKKIRDFNLKDESVKKIIQQRYGNNLPLDMKVVAPSDILNSELLETVR